MCYNHATLWKVYTKIHPKRRKIYSTIFWQIYKVYHVEIILLKQQIQIQQAFVQRVIIFQIQSIAFVKSPSDQN